MPHLKERSDPDAKADHGTIWVAEDHKPKYRNPDDAAGAVQDLATSTDVDAAITAHEAAGDPHPTYALDTDLSTHEADASAHHTRYTDGEAVEAVRPTFRTITSGSIADSDHNNIVYVNSASTPVSITLPTTGITTGFICSIVNKHATGTVKLVPASGTLRGTDGNNTIGVQYGGATVWWDGSNWYAVGVTEAT